MFFTFKRFQSLPSLLFTFLSLFSFGVPAFAGQAQKPSASERFTLEPSALYAVASKVEPSVGTNVTVIDEEESYSYDDSGRASYSGYTVFKIHTQKGVEGWSGVAVYWEPWHQERPTIKVRVIAPDFTVHELDTNTLTDSPAQDEEANVYSDRRVLRGPLPAVAPGSVVEQEILIKDTAPAFAGGSLVRYYFGKFGIPVLHARLLVEVPATINLKYSLELLSEMQPQRTEVNGRAQYLFEHGPMEARDEPETNLPSDVPAFPSVTFSTGSSWRQVAREYAAVVDKQIVTAETNTLADKLVRGKQSRTEKAQAILSYLSREIRYTGIEFGESTLVPHSPSETLTRKYGDCKDKATLLIAILRSAGIPAYPALLNAGDRLDVTPDLPGVGLFDHLIVFAPGNPDLWIDPTDNYSRIGQLAISDQGRYALVARPETTTLVRTPEGNSKDNLVVEHRDIFLKDYGAARVVERTQPHGPSESAYRRSYTDKQNKSVKEELTKYVKTEYLAEDLDQIDRSDPEDISRQFELVLESKEAKRGFTDLQIAVAAIRLESLFDRLPAELRRKQDDSKSGDRPTKPKRTADYQLPVAFVTEWRYTIQPPEGFVPKPLPKNEEAQIGPGLLTEQFSVDTQNRVLAVLRFDTVKRRLTYPEAEQMRDKIVQFTQAPPVVIYFEPAGQPNLNEGNFRAGLQQYRDAIAKSPKQAVPHLRMAQALLTSGFAEAARREARVAVTLDPASALAQKTLADVLQHDLVGRNLRPGSDFEGAAKAYAEAEKLDPKAKDTIGKLAILLEFDRFGLRYGSTAKLKDSISEYRKLSIEEQKDLSIQNNLPFVLFHARDFSAAEQAGRDLNPPLVGLIVASAAAKNGAAAGLAEARKLVSGEEQFRNVASAAADLLEDIREYQLAADFKQAGAAGDVASDMQADASLLRKTQRHEEMKFSDTPADIALQFAVTIDNADLKLAELRALCSRNGAQALAIEEVRKHYAEAQSHINSEKSRKGQFADVGIDLSLTRAQPSVQGSDATGYKVTLWPSATYKQAYYVIKEEGRYKVLANSRYAAGIGLEVLDRIAANDLAGARTLLDWLREDLRLPGGDDPLAGLPFPRFWIKGRDADPEKMKLAAASILVATEGTAARGLSILEDARQSARADGDKTNIALALVLGYQRTRQHEKGLVVANELYEQNQDSDSAFRWKAIFLRITKRFPEANQFAQSRLQRIPDDPDAMRQLVWNSIAQEDYAKTLEILQKIMASGKGTYSDLNQIAWYSLFAGSTNQADLEASLKAAQLSNNNPSLLHTLGCVYAELGKLREAQLVLVQAMDAANLDEPNPDYWYAFARIAEQAGDKETAVTFYNRVTQPEDALDLVGSSYHLAQNRLRAIRTSAK